MKHAAFLMLYQQWLSTLVDTCRIGNVLAREMERTVKEVASCRPEDLKAAQEYLDSR